MKDLKKWTGLVTEILNMEDLKGQGLESSHKDDQPFIRKLSTPVEIKEAHDGVFPWIMSDETVDRDFDIIEAKGWDLSEFSGTLLFGHDYRSLPIGKVENARIDTKRKALIGDVSFTDEATNPHGAMVQRLVEGGYLKTGSVGFLPMAWEDIQDNDKDGEEKEDKEKNKRKPRRRYTKQSLMEFSIVPVPSNPGAIQLAYSKGILGDEDQANKFLKEMFDKTLNDFSEATDKVMKDLDALKDALEDEDQGEEEDKGLEHHEEKGERLAAFLNRRIDAIVTEERSRSVIIANMATAAGIAVNTVQNILNANIICPPLARLQGFARALSMSASSIRQAAERDGCEYDTRGMVTHCPVIEGRSPFADMGEDGEVRPGEADEEAGSSSKGRPKEVVSTIKHEFQPEFTEALKGLKNLGQDLGQLLIKEMKETIAQFKDLAEQIKKLVDDKSKAPAESGNPGLDAQGNAKDESQSVYDMIYESGKKIQSIAKEMKGKKNERCT